MITALPPRPISVNSLTRVPIQSALSVQHSKATNRCTRAEVQIHDDPDMTKSMMASLEYPPGPDTEMADPDDLPEAMPQASRPELQFENLPIEIHEAIIDCLFGERTSALSNTSIPGKPAARSWVKALRHPRRKALTNLTLISPQWRHLVQQRIYRHIKVKGTKDGLAEAEQWFDLYPHLAPYVRHIELWVPVWGTRASTNTAPHLRDVTLSRRYVNEDVGLDGVAAVLQETMAGWDDPESHTQPSSQFSFHSASHNATLEEIFSHVKSYYPECVMFTLEAGHCKKPPLIRHFANDPSGLSGLYALEALPNIQTFVMRGAWNIMRNYRHWVTLADALPSLREWHCSYAKPKLEGLQTVAKALSNLSSSVVRLDISLEGFHNKDASHWLSEKTGQQHLCRLLGDVLPQLEQLTFTGNVCACLFSDSRTATAGRQTVSRLKSLDLVVKTCCRETRDEPSPSVFEEPTSITNMNFIRSFEKLVLGGVGSLEHSPDLSYIRMRFIDLDSTCALLNPYFQMANNVCSGLWSDQIVETLDRVRPATRYVELSDGIYPQIGADNVIVGAIYPRIRPMSINASMYKILSDAAKS